MISNSEKKIIKAIYDDIVTRYEFPKFGSPEIHCDKCMFYGIACHPSHEYVGCFHGWKREEKAN